MGSCDGHVAITRTELGQDVPNFLRDVAEKGDDIIGCSWKALAKLFVLCGDPNGALVGMADASHNASFGDHCDCSESKFFSAHRGSHNHIPTTFQT